jgi:DNA invertase Pin-like site-specific DNA recombinase
MTWQNKTKRAVAYYRSTVAEGDETIESQREQVREWAEKHGLEIIREFEDRGASGLHTEPHAGFDELMRRVKKDRSFQFVLCADVTHWGRCHDMDLPPWFSDECLKAGKAVIYTKITDCQNPDPFLPIFLHFERLRYNDCCSQGRRIRRGLMRAADQGYWTGGNPPYGMRRLLVDKDGNPLHSLEPGQRKTVHNHRVALVAGEPAEVAAIRRIFHEFVDRGYSRTQIAAGLNAKRLPSPRGGSWNARQVLACLRTQAYAKPITYRLKKSRRGKTSDQWVRTPKASDGIINLQQFQRAQEILV